MISASAITFSALLAIAASAPTPEPAVPLAQVRFIGTTASQFTPSSQMPSGDGGHTMSIPLGPELFLGPMKLQGIEVAQDSNASCTVTVQGANDVTVESGKGPVMLSLGRVVEAMSIICTLTKAA